MQSHSKSTYFVIVCVQFKKFKYFYCNNIKDLALNDCFIQQVAMFLCLALNILSCHLLPYISELNSVLFSVGLSW